MLEIIGDPGQAPGWEAAIKGEDVDWDELLDGYVAQVDWPGASFWRELSAANPDALVVLSTRDPGSWYRSASNTIFNVFAGAPPGLDEWFGAVQRMCAERFCDDFDDPAAMIAAFERHNDEVRDGVPADRLLEWTAAEGWEPLCERLEIPVPDEPFPVTNRTNDTRALIGLPPLPAPG